MLQSEGSNIQSTFISKEISSDLWKSKIIKTYQPCHSEIQVLTRRYRYLLGYCRFILADTCTYLYRYLLADTGTYSQIQVLTCRYMYLLVDTGTYSEIEILTRRYKYLLADTRTNLEIHVLTRRYS